MKKIFSILFALALVLGLGLVIAVETAIPVLGATPQLFENYNTGNNTFGNIYGSCRWEAQTFKPSVAHIITSVKLKLYRVGSPGTITVSVTSTSGGEPDGPDLCSGTTNGDTLTDSTSGEWREITFGSSCSLSSGTTYTIVVKAIGGDSLNKLCWQCDSSGAYGDGKLLLTTTCGSNWNPFVNADMMFEEWGCLPPTEVWVDDDWNDQTDVDAFDPSLTWQCDAFNKIQDGIDAVAGSTVHVAAGTYGITSHIAISKSVTIIGDPASKPVVQALNSFDTSYGGTSDYFFRGDPAVTATINISNLVLDGNGYDVYGGMRFYPTHSGTIENCVFQNLKEPTGSPYLGVAIANYGSFTIANNVFTGIGRVGVWIGGPGNIVSNNVYTGKGAGDWLDYGVEVEMGGVATITGNTITSCTGVASSDGSTSAAILVTTYFGAGTTATITGNTLTGNTEAIAVGYGASDTSVVTAHFNNIYGNTYGLYTTNPSVDATCNWWGAADGPGDQGPGHGDTVGTSVTFARWLGAKITDQPAGCTADTATGASASPCTNHVSAAATGGGGDTTVYVAEYAGNPSGLSTGFVSCQFFFDVRVDGTVPTTLVIDVTCPGTSLVWFDGTKWLPVSPTTRIGGILRATLSNTSSPTITQLTGQPFGSGNPGAVVGWETYPISKTRVLLPWIAILGAIAAGVSLLMLRRRRAQG